METTLAISIIALLISLGSFGVTILATRLSKKSLDHALKSYNINEEKEFERVRGEILMQIADNRRLLDKTRIEIGTLEANFEIEKQPVKVIMGKYTNLFSEYLPTIVEGIEQLDNEWEDVSSWTNETDHRTLIETKSRLYRALKDFEVAYDSGMYMINEFNEKLKLANEYTENATRQE